MGYDKLLEYGQDVRASKLYQDGYSPEEIASMLTKSTSGTGGFSASMINDFINEVLIPNGVEVKGKRSK